MDDVIKTTVFLTDMSNFKEMKEITQHNLLNPILRSTIGVKRLPMP